MPYRAINYFKQLLEKTRDTIKEQIRRLSIIPDRGIDRAALEEEADQEEEFINKMSTAQIFKERLADVDMALVKMKKGKYGICAKCGKKMSPKLLKVAPESRICMECKKKARNRLKK